MGFKEDEGKGWSGLKDLELIMKEQFKECGAPAHVRYTWPGKDESYACLIHASGIFKIADAMGLYLQFIPIDWMDKKTIETMPLCKSKEKIDG